MAEPVIYGWMREAANKIIDRYEASGGPPDIAHAIAAAFADHDVERMLMQLGEDTGGYPVTVRVRPKECQEATKMPAVSVEFYDENHHRGEGYKSAPSIPAAVAAAREAMGQ